PNDNLACPVRSLSPADHNRKMVIEEIPLLAILGGNLAVSKLKPRSVVLATPINGDKACRPRQIIRNPLRDIPILDKLTTPFDILPADFLSTQRLTLHVLAHHEFEIRGHDSITT